MVGPDAVEFDEQVVDFPAGISNHLGDIAEFLAVAADQFGVNQLRFA